MDLDLDKDPVHRESFWSKETGFENLIKGDTNLFLGFRNCMKNPDALF